MGRVWAGGQAGQGELAIVDADARLPADHPAREVIRLVARLDLSRFEAAYRADGRGRPPYHPAVMLALLLYCRADGRTSSLQVADACHDDLGAMLITGNRHPHRRTIDEFRRTHRKAIAGLLPQTLRLGHDLGLVDVSVVAGDSTMVQANAAMAATVTEAELTAQIGQLQQQLDAALALWQMLAGAETTGQIDLFDGLHLTPGEAPADLPDPAVPAATAATAQGAWRTVCTLHHRLQARQQTLARLRDRPATASLAWVERFERDQQRVTRCTQRLEQATAEVAAANQRRAADESTGAKIPGARPVPVQQHNKVVRARQALDKATTRAQATAAARPVTGRINTTDPTSRLMPTKHGGYDQLHNLQALACPNQFIIAIGLHDNPNDKQALTGLLHQDRANLDTAHISDRIGVALFDSGYASATNFTTDHPVDLLLVAVEQEARQTGRRHDGTHTAATAWQHMTDRLATPENNALYKRRAGIIEPLFAQLFNRFGRRIHARGADVETELHLWAIAHNLLKISRHHRTRPG